MISFNLLFVLKNLWKKNYEVQKNLKRISHVKQPGLTKIDDPYALCQDVWKNTNKITFTEESRISKLYVKNSLKLVTHFYSVSRTSSKQKLVSAETGRLFMDIESVGWKLTFFLLQILCPTSILSNMSGLKNSLYQSRKKISTVLLVHNKLNCFCFVHNKTKNKSY